MIINSEFDHNYLLEKSFTCPICRDRFKYVQSKSMVFKVEKRNPDLSVVYRDINPVYYEAVMCEKCGYAAFSKDFEIITQSDKKRIKDKICFFYREVNLPKEKNLKDALELFEHVYKNYDVRYKKNAELAKCALRLMWFFNEAGRFKDALEYSAKALHHYLDANLDGAYNTDEKAVYAYYIIGELYRIQGIEEEAHKWYRKALITNSTVKNSLIQQFAEDQIALLVSKRRENS